MSVRNNENNVPLVEMLELNLEELCLHTVNEICGLSALEVWEEGKRREKLSLFWFDSGAMPMHL